MHVAMPEAWNPILDEISETFGLLGVNLFCGDCIHPEATNAWVDQRVRPVFDEWLTTREALIEALLYPLIPQYLPEKQFSSLKQFKKNCFENKGLWPEDYYLVDEWLARKVGEAERYYSPLNVHPAYLDFITFHFPRHQALSEQILGEANQLLPHIAKVNLLNRPFVLLEARFNAVLSVLDKFYLSVVIMDGRRHVIVKNNAADQLLANADSIALNLGQQLKMLAPDDQAFLENVIAAPAIPEKTGTQRYRKVLTRKNGKMPYFAELTLLGSMLSGEAGPCWALIIVDPEQKEIVSTDGIESIYDLTKSEQRVVQALVDGLSLNDIAENYAVSSETIKSHTKSIYNKLGCHSRAELINLAHQVNLPISAADTCG